MSDNMNPLYQARVFLTSSQDPRNALEEAQQRARIMEIQRGSIQAGLGNLSSIRNPLHPPPGWQEESISGPPPPMSVAQYTGRVPANGFPNRPPPGYAPGYPSSAYPTPGYPSSGYLPPVYPTPGYYPTPGHPPPGHPTPAPAAPPPAAPPPAAPPPAAPPPAAPARAKPVPAIPTAPVAPAPAPPVHPYMRPALEEDAEEIAQIINYYKSVSPFDPEFQGMLPKHAYNFIKASILRKLPCLVLVKPPDPSQTSQGPPKSQICGISYVDLFDEEITDTSFGDLRVYVHPGMTRNGYGTLLVDCLLSLCDQHYLRKFQCEWRPVGGMELQVLRLRELVCVIPYPAQLERNYLFTWQWLKNTFGFLKLGEVKQDRAKYGYEESHYIVHLYINAGRIERQVPVPKRYERMPAPERYQ